MFSFFQKQKFECLEQKKFFERAIKKTGGPSILNKFALKKVKPAAPVRLQETKVEEEFKPEVESDEEEESSKIQTESVSEVKDQVSQESLPSSSNIEVREEMDLSEVTTPEVNEDTKVDELEIHPIPPVEEVSKTPETIEPPSQKPPETTSHKRKHTKTKKNKSFKGNRTEVDIDDVDERDDQYVKWVPPKNQSGDGRSSLNDKYGY